MASKIAAYSAANTSSGQIGIRQQQVAANGCPQDYSYSEATAVIPITNPKPPRLLSQCV